MAAPWQSEQVRLHEMLVKEQCLCTQIKHKLDPVITLPSN